MYVTLQVQLADEMHWYNIFGIITADTQILLNINPEDYSIYLVPLASLEILNL